MKISFPLILGTKEIFVFSRLQIILIVRILTGWNYVIFIFWPKIYLVEDLSEYHEVTQLKCKDAPDLKIYFPTNRPYP